MHVTYCDVFSFVWCSLVSFLDCFRARNDVPLVRNEEESEKIRLSSLFADEEKGHGGHVVEEKQNLVRRISRPEIEEGLLEEVKLLKACGTIPETPAEVRRAVKFSKEVEKFDVEKHLQSPPETPSIITEEGLPELLGAENSGRSHSAVESSPETPEEMQKSEFAAGISDKSVVREPRSMFKASPFPTPRMITDDMQTPGTVYATNMRSLTIGNARIRSQYVYTVVNPIDSLCLFDDLNEEHSPTRLSSDNEGENLLHPGNAATLPTKESSGKTVSEETPSDASLSSWLKPPRFYGDADSHKQESTNTRKHIDRNTPRDKPTIDFKWRDGNGIPNSMTKYKEDQKVHWRATPFEERLDKALSEEICAPQRKPLTGVPIIFEELEGQETATSLLHTLPNSIVSF